MTKKDYQAIARALYEATQTTAHADARLAAPSATRYLMAHVVNNLARVLASDNPRFDRDTFVQACETGDVTRRPKRKRAPMTAEELIHGRAGAAQRAEANRRAADQFETLVAAVEIPPCVQAMRCYCAGHARGLAYDMPCDTRE